MIRNILKELSRINFRAFDLKQKINTLSPDKIHYILKFFEYHEFLPLLYLNLKKLSLNLPRSEENKLKGLYYSNILKNITYISEFTKLSKSFEDENIRFVPLKGINFLHVLYPEINSRTLVDLDILVNYHNLEKIEKILQSLGYKLYLSGMKRDYWLKHHCHLIYEKKESFPIYLEIHWALDFNRIKNLDVSKLIKERRYVEEKGMWTLKPEYSIIVLALHQRRFHKPLILKNVLDLKLLIEKFELDWRLLLRLAWLYRLRYVLNLIFKELTFFYDQEMPREFVKNLKVPFLINKLQEKLIRESLFDLRFFKNYEKQKFVYFKLYFLVYDSLWEALFYLINLPQEKFARFFNLRPYGENTSLIYRMRIIYTPTKFLLLYFKRFF